MGGPRLIVSHLLRQQPLVFWGWVSRPTRDTEGFHIDEGRRVVGTLKQQNRECTNIFSRIGFDRPHFFPAFIKPLPVKTQMERLPVVLLHRKKPRLYCPAFFLTPDIFLFARVIYYPDFFVTSRFFPHALYSPAFNIISVIAPQKKRLS